MSEITVFFLAEDSALSILLCDALAKELGCKVYPFGFIDDKHLVEEAMDGTVKCFVLCPDITIEIADIEREYKIWRSKFPEMPFMLHNPDENASDFPFVKYDERVKVFLTDECDALKNLVKLIRQYVS